MSENENSKSNKENKPIYKKGWFWVIILFAFFYMMGDDPETGISEEGLEEIVIAEESDEIENEAEIELEDLKEDTDSAELEIEEDSEEVIIPGFVFDPDDYNTGITYNDMARTDDNMYDNVKFSGTIVQMIHGDNYNRMRMAIDDNYNEIIFVQYESDKLDYRLLEDDLVTIYGFYLGMDSYETVLGATVTIPSVFADNIELIED